MVSRRAYAIAGVFAVVPCTLAFAQDAATYPNKPIRLIIPFAPGGAVDITGRLVAGELSKALGKTVVVDNRAGASGTIGVAEGVKAAGDGYTITQISVSLLINQYVLPSVPYDLRRDFVPLSQLTRQPNALVINPSVPARNVKELITYAKANPGKLNYGSTGIGSIAHLVVALLGQMTGVQMTHVTYKGGSQAIQDVLAGNIQMCSCTLQLAGPHIKSGRLRALAVTTAQRASGAPDIPTIAESGVPGYEVTSWHGLLLPLKTAPAIVARLNREIVRIMQLPEVEPKLALDGAEAVGSTSAEFATMLNTESTKWSKLVKAIGVKSE